MSGGSEELGRIAEAIGHAVARKDWTDLDARIEELNLRIAAGEKITDDRHGRMILEALCAASSLGAFDTTVHETSQQAADLLADIVRAARSEPPNVEALRARTRALIELLETPSVRVRADPPVVPHGAATMPSPSPIRDALEALRSVREWLLLARLTDGLMCRGDVSPLVRIFLAQAQIELDFTSSGIAVLKELLVQHDLSPAERAKATGLLGRAYKQIYVDHRGDDAASVPGRIRGALQASIRYYRAIYRPDALAGRDDENSRWAGINYAAVLAIAERDHVLPPVGSGETSRSVGRHIADAIIPRLKDFEDDPWVLVTVAESLVAAGGERDIELAAGYFARFAGHPRTDAFQLAGTVRQLEEAWHFRDGDGSNGIILEALRTRLLRMGGELAFSDLEAVRPRQLPGGDATDRTPAAGAAGNSDQTIYEAIVGDTVPTPVDWLDRGRAAAKSVARIRHREGKTYGTGFLVRGAQLHKDLGEAYYLLTNNHVVCTQQHPHLGALLPDEARVVFDDEQRKFKTRPFSCKVVWTSPVAELDATLLRLEDADADADQRLKRLGHLTLASHLPDVMVKSPGASGKPRAALVYIIGHTGGQEKYISMKNNDLLAKGPRADGGSESCHFVHYRAPTEHGNSGSPVFDENDWNVIALHHASQGEWARLKDAPKYRGRINEGISIVSIRAAIEAAVESGAISSSP